MDLAKLEAVKAIFGVKTETEAVDLALKKILFEHKVARGLDRLKSAGGLPGARESGFTVVTKNLSGFQLMSPYLSQLVFTPPYP